MSARSSPDPTVSDNENHGPAQPVPLTRSNRPSRACTLRAAERLQAQQQQVVERKPKSRKKDQRRRRQRPEMEEEEEDDDEGDEENDDETLPQCSGSSKIITSLVGVPESSQMPRWSLRSMWELASVLNFLHVFRPLLNITAEFSAEELETALLTPNNTLATIHIPLLKAIPPVTRMALTRDTWVTVLCRKIRDWWHWVAEGDLPIVASHGLEIEAYRTLEPGMRVLILKALCDIRVEQEDIRSYIDNSIKQGVKLGAFRKERVGGDSNGVNYWYEDDAVIGHRLYREIRTYEVKKTRTKGSQVHSNASYQWETVATNFEEFQDVSEKLFASKNRTEVSLAKKLKIDMLPEIEKEYKRKEKLLKKQHRQALLLDNYMGVDGLATGRSLRDRKPVTYTFDAYDRTITEAIKITKKKPPSPEPNHRREPGKHETSTNGRWAGPSYSPEDENDVLSSKSSDYNDADEEDDDSVPLDRSNRQRQRSRRYSAKEYVETVSDNDVESESDDDIVGEAVYDEEYIKKRQKRRKLSSSSEGDEEYDWDEDNAEDDEEEEESMSISEDSDEPRKFKKLPSRTRRGTKSRSAGNQQPGLRRSNRASRNRINYKQYEISDSETESVKPDNFINENSEDESDNPGFSMGSSHDSEKDEQEMEVDLDHHQPVKYYNEAVKKEEENSKPIEKLSSPSQDEIEGVQNRQFLDLNELAPGSCFDDGNLNPVVKDDDTGKL